MAEPRSRRRRLTDRVAGQLHRYLERARPVKLARVPLEDLTAELLSRIDEGAFDRESTVLLGCQIQEALGSALDVHRNRFSAARYRDTLWTVQEALRLGDATLDDATVLDIGCGSLNPYATVFLLLLVGAGRGIAIDLDPVQDVRRAMQALAEAAAMLLIDPARVAGDLPVERDTVLARLRGFDLARLGVGDPAGLDHHRLTFRQESIERLSLPPAQADVVISNAVLEHLPDVDAAMAELARITRPGGLQIHTIDGSDHRRYADPQHHPLAFLTEPGDEPLTYGSNRLRPTEFADAAARHGFDVLSFVPIEDLPIDRAFRRTLAAPYRSLSDRALAVVSARLFLRRR